MPKVSIVILSRNEEKRIKETLEAVFSQEATFDFEVVVIDSGSTDKTLQIIKGFPVRLYQIAKEEFNHGLTRNYGVSLAQGEIVVLLGADAVPADTHWMRTLVDNLFEDARVAGVYSCQLPHKDATVLTQLRVNRAFTSKKKKLTNRLEVSRDFLSLSPGAQYALCNFDNVSSCIRKKIGEQFPFVKTDFAEDLAWGKTVIQAGFTLVYEPLSVVYHSHDFTAPQWYQKNKVHAQALYKLFGLKKIDSLCVALSYFVWYICRDFSGILRSNAVAIHKFRSLGSFIGTCWRGVVGQYHGGRFAQCIYEDPSRRP
ncbi:MAG: glycosyltransferase [Candidatus Omnitrophica bacterium]|nr:glycosyltransferase [Candidatus Omnitrophota bacterium]